MARDRLISPQSTGPVEEHSTFALRPVSLGDVVGQRQVVEQVHIAMQAATGRGEPLEHILLDGPPGLGKTTLAHVVANEMTGRPPRVTSGPVLNKTGDLMSLLTNLEEGEILFIDEIHRLPKVVEEFLYPAMEDYRIDYTIEGGLGARTVRFALQRFTLIGATTRAGLLSPAIRDRFGIRFHFEFYNHDELATILRRSCRLLNLPFNDDALTIIASRSRGTPRVANRLLRRVRDYTQVRGSGVLEESVVREALDILRIDELGLDELDRSYLRTLITVYGGGPVGVEALAATTGQERDTLEDVVEPYLLQLGFVFRTRQGRQATERGFAHLNVAYTPPTSAADQASLFES